MAWPSSGAAGYKVYVGSQSGLYDRVIEAGSALRATVSGLEDDRVYHIAVKGYDAAGRLSTGYSPELACLPKPRIDIISPSSLLPGQIAYVTFEGANFDPDLQARAREMGMRVRSVVFAGPGRLTALIEAPAAGGPADGPVVLRPEQFTLINPCRKADAYFAAHPEAVDLDGSGRVDAEDLAMVRSLFGAHRGDPTYANSADLDADGAIDGLDIARITSRIGGPGTVANANANVRVNTNTSTTPANASPANR